MLNNTSCKNAKPKEKPYKIYDEKGLYLEIAPNGSKYWRFKYRFTKKEKRLALGVYPEISLKEAREKRDTARNQLANNLDPSVIKQEAKLQSLADTEHSFETIARWWHNGKKEGWTERHAKYVLRRFELDIFPLLGSKPIYDITPPELLAVLRKVEERGAIDIAHRLLQTAGQVFRYAIASGIAKHDISTDLRGALKTRKSGNYASLQGKRIPLSEL